IHSVRDRVRCWPLTADAVDSLDEPLALPLRGVARHGRMGWRRGTPRTDGITEGTMNSCDRLILVAQPGYQPIAEATMHQLVPSSLHSMMKECVTIQAADAVKRAVTHGNWDEARQVIARQFATELRPRLERYPEARVLYFGSAPVPAAILLG